MDILLAEIRYVKLTKPIFGTVLGRLWQLCGMLTVGYGTVNSYVVL